jgi:hypothetical protein
MAKKKTSRRFEHQIDWTQVAVTAVKQVGAIVVRFVSALVAAWLD